jgi:O-acetyl-ADP-ribose deacetylase (regulator of RNase III)
MATIIEINGDLFQSNSQTLVNTVNCDGIMGKGIALEFKKKFPDMFLTYEDLCKKQMIKPGVLFLYKKSKPWILNFPTKNHWKFPSKLEYIRLGLAKFSKEYESKGITSIAFPKLGTLNGGLEWEDVKQLMYQYLEPLPNLYIEIYHFDSSTDDLLYIKFIDLVKQSDVMDLRQSIGLTRKHSIQSIMALEISNNWKK